MRRRFLLFGVLLIGAAARSRAQAPAGTAFTYQGRLNDGAGPGNNDYGLQFRLFDAATLGSQIGGPITLSPVPVAGGLFTVTLDFGANAFGGDARWLEIAVQPMGGGGFTVLAPRQELRPTPYAQTIFRRTVVVRPVGTSAQNGAALVNALASITTASAATPWLVRIEPGIYFVGAAGTLAMKPFVDLEGSGEDVTTISAAGSSANAAGTILCADNSELRFVTVRSVGGGAAYAKAIYASGTSPRLLHVTAVAGGATSENQGVFVESGGAARATFVTAQASAAGSARAYGFLNIGGSSSVMTNVVASGSGGDTAVAVFNFGSSNPEMKDVTATASGAATYNWAVTNIDSGPAMTRLSVSASGGVYSYGVTWVNSGTTSLASLPLTDSEVTTGAATAESIGVRYDNLVGGTLRNVRITGSAGTATRTGITCFGSSVLASAVTIDVSGGTVTTAGVQLLPKVAAMTYVSSIDLRHSSVNGTAGAGGSGYGILSDSSYVEVESSRVTGYSTRSISMTTTPPFTPSADIVNSFLVNPLFVDTNCSVTMTLTRMLSSVIGPGTKTCAGVTDLSSVFHLTTCP